MEIFFKHNSIYRPGLTWKQTYLYFWAGLQVRPSLPTHPHSTSLHADVLWWSCFRLCWASRRC